MYYTRQDIFLKLFLKSNSGSFLVNENIGYSNEIFENR